MITNVTSKVDLPASASSRSHTDALQKSKPAGEQTRGSDISVTASTHRDELERAVTKVKEVLQRSGSQFQIEVDPDLDRVVVKILNGDSGEVIRQIPPKEVIDLAKNLSGSKGALFEEHV